MNFFRLLKLTALDLVAQLGRQPHMAALTCPLLNLHHGQPAAFGKDALVAAPECRVERSRPGRCVPRAADAIQLPGS